MSARGHEYLHFDPFSIGGRVSKGCSMIAWTVLSVVAYVSEYTDASYKQLHY